MTQIRARSREEFNRLMWMYYIPFLEELGMEERLQHSFKYLSSEGTFFVTHDVEVTLLWY